MNIMINTTPFAETQTGEITDRFDVMQLQPGGFSRQSFDDDRTLVAVWPR